MKEVDNDDENNNINLEEENKKKQIIQIVESTLFNDNENEEIEIENNEDDEKDIIKKLSEKIDFNPTNNNSYNFIKHNSSYKTIHNSNFNIDTLIYYLSTREQIGVIDELINILYMKFQNDSLFYIPQLCSFLIYKQYNTPIENYILDSCIDRMKFSLTTFWTTFSNQTFPKMEELQQNIEITLVNNRRYSLKSSIKSLRDNNKNELDYENKLIHESIFKEFKLNYFNYVFKFYEKLRTLCKKLKDTSSKDRNNVLRESLKKYNKKIKEEKEKSFENIPQSFDLVTNAFFCE